MPHAWADLLMRDHELIERVIAACTRSFHEGGPLDDDVLRGLLSFVTDFVDGCHHHKEEDHLFPLLEARGLPAHGGPLAVMLAEHEQSRGLIAQLTELIDRHGGGDTSVRDQLVSTFNEYAALVQNHIWKENDILYPMGRRLLDEAAGEQVVSGIATVEEKICKHDHAYWAEAAERLARKTRLRDLSVHLDRDVLGALLNTLPVELSFVDADDTVRYFSHENHPKIFPRTRGVIGFKVQECHPEKSLPLVNQILADFRAGKRDVAEFWLDFQERKIHVRYFPVRDNDGAYLGTLEVVQDITHIQALTGERRLLDEA